jgi:hypothetical protein
MDIALCMCITHVYTLCARVCVCVWYKILPAESFPPTSLMVVARGQHQTLFLTSFILVRRTINFI